MKGHNSDTNLENTTCIYPKLDLVNINLYTKFGENMSISSQGIERKGSFGVNQGP